MIYAFGNSHSHFFTNSTPSTIGEGENKNKYFRSFSIGPATAYNFYEHHLPIIIEYINNLSISTNDFILLVIGEVDCRWHLPKQSVIQNRHITEVTHECIDRFFRSHLHLQSHGYNVIGWGGHPSTIDGHNDDPSCPVYGDCQFRNQTSVEWNNYLENKCSNNNIEFVSIIKDLINLDGTTKMEYYKDYCHLDSEKYLPVTIEKFKVKHLL